MQILIRTRNFRNIFNVSLFQDKFFISLIIKNIFWQLQIQHFFKNWNVDVSTENQKTAIFNPPGRDDFIDDIEITCLSAH